jgi:hypothetical protein
MGYLERFSEMLRQKNRRFERIDGQLFVRKRQWIAPLGPASQAYHLNEAQCRELLRKLGGLWVMWTDGFESPAPGSEWYALVCRRHIPVEEVVSENTRKQIRRGLKRCEVRQVEVREIAQNGYETYCAAIGDYGKQAINLPTEEEFARRVMTDESFGDIRHQWAAFYEGKMVGFTQNLLYGKTEVDYTLGKWHPQYLKHYPSYALFYKMNEFYLAQKEYPYINAGSRSISHETGVQEFLIKKFGFEKAYTGLHVHYRPPFGQLLRMVRPFRPAITAIYPKVRPLFELDRLKTRFP